MSIRSSFGGTHRFMSHVSALYAFTAHTFTNCGVTGATGPTLAQMQAAYSGQSWAQDSNFFTLGAYQGYQKWKVPASGNYTFDVRGAAGGATGYNPTYPGRGARAQTTLALVAGEWLAIVVGQAGSFGGLVGGGGGGSFVVRLSDNTPLIIAGGGAGAFQLQDHRSNGDAPAAEAAQVGTHYVGNTQGAPGAGGFYSNGANSVRDSGGMGYGSGLTGSPRNVGESGRGGFGGGSSGEWVYYGSTGHGGGYSGGSRNNTGYGGLCSSYYSAGGGSLISASGSSSALTAGYNSGAGSVAITKV